MLITFDGCEVPNLCRRPTEKPRVPCGLGVFFVFGMMVTILGRLRSGDALDLLPGVLAMVD